MLRCTDQVVIEIVSCRGRDTIARVVDETHGNGAAPRIIGLPSADVLACFQGTALERAHAVARLKPAQFRKVFGSQYETVNHYHVGKVFRRVGRMIRPLERGGSRAALAALGGMPLRFLRVAARYTDPEEQVRRAVFAQVAEAARGRRRRSDDEALSL